MASTRGDAAACAAEPLSLPQIFCSRGAAVLAGVSQGLFNSNAHFNALKQLVTFPPRSLCPPLPLLFTTNGHLAPAEPWGASRNEARAAELGVLGWANPSPLPGSLARCCTASVGNESFPPGSFYLSDTRGPPCTPSRAVEDGSLPGGGSLPFSTLACSFPPPPSHPQARRHLLCAREWAGREAQAV